MPVFSLLPKQPHLMFLHLSKHVKPRSCGITSLNSPRSTSAIKGKTWIQLFNLILVFSIVRINFKEMYTFHILILQNREKSEVLKSPNA